MRYPKLTLVTSFALFSLFFGAGNIILPPYLGFTSGSNWIWVALGFLVTAVIIPIFGIRAHGTILGIVVCFGTTGGAVGPIFTGQLFDMTGSYATAFSLFILISACSLGILSLLKPIK